MCPSDWALLDSFLLAHALQHVRQANRALNQGKDSILKDVAPSKKAEGAALLDKLQDGLQEFQRVVEKKDRAAVPVMQKATLAIVGE